MYSTKMRILALPLTRQTTAYPLKFPLVYYHVRMPPQNNSNTKPGLVKRAQDRANQYWSDLGKAEGGWKLKVYKFGEKLYDRLDFEEIALRSIDPALGPHIASISEGSKAKGALEQGERISIPLMYPTDVSPSKPLDHLSSLVNHRRGKHLKWFWIFAGVAPLTAPFAIVPVIPNLPFFFCAWRAWSHWKAYKAADYLKLLISHNAVIPTPSPLLNEVYATHPPGEGSPLLVTRQMVPSLVEKMKLTPESTPDLIRAIEQAKARIDAKHHAKAS